jgi:hypothetical protein
MEREKPGWFPLFHVRMLLFGFANERLIFPPDSRTASLMDSFLSYRPILLVESLKERYPCRLPESKLQLEG